MARYTYTFEGKTFNSAPMQFVDTVINHNPELKQRYENANELSYPNKKGQKFYYQLARRMEKELSREGWHVSISILKERAAEESKATQELEKIENEQSPFNPKNVEDGRTKTYGYIARRRGGKKFRDNLLKAYGGYCAITKCNLKDALEACHIIPYKGPDTDHVTNGVLLRADLHILFDLKLFAIDADEKKVLLAPHLKGSAYDFLDGANVLLPAEEVCKPNREALAMHRKEAQATWE